MNRSNTNDGVENMEGKIYEYLEKYNYENLFFFNDNETGLKGVVCIHDTTLGPATGGLRMWTYQNEWDAIEDSLRLGRGMTYKYAAAGVDLGGGKAVIIGDPKSKKVKPCSGHLDALSID